MNITNDMILDAVTLDVAKHDANSNSVFRLGRIVCNDVEFYYCVILERQPKPADEAHATVGLEPQDEEVKK